MTAAVEPDPPQAAPTRPPPVRGRLAEWGWSRVRWLAEEVTIIVVGILIALAIQSWVDDRDDRAREQEYLHQLAADLRETERVVMRNDSVRMLTAEQLAAEEVWLRASQQLGHALDFSEGIELLLRTPQDSLALAEPSFYLPAGPRRRPFPVDVEAFLRSREAYDGVANMYWGKQNMAYFRAARLQGARALRARVEAALAK